MTSPTDPSQLPFGQAHRPSSPPMHPQPGAVGTIAPPTADDPDEMPLPKGRGPASTKFLLVGLAVVVAFGLGVMAQKKNDAGMIRPPKGPAAALAAAAGAGAAAPPGGAAAAEPGEHPLLAGAKLKGELVSVNGTEFVVKDAKGIERRATTSTSTLVVKAVPLDQIPPGTKVYVGGTDAADGSTTAIIVVVPQ